MMISLSAATGEHAPDDKYNDRADDGTNQAGTFTWRVPAKRLPEKRSDECANDTKDGGQDESRRLVGARHDELGDYTGDKANEDCPNNSHKNLPHPAGARRHKFARALSFQ
jgi:hypothetical protein